MDVRCERARLEDLAGVLRLLEENHLPVEGLKDYLDTTIVLRRNNAIVGSAGLELYQDGALLQSVAVTPSLQGQGLGHQLTDAAIHLAQELGTPAIYLLTTTAERLFPRFGFEPTAREHVPQSVQASVEFRFACPAMATVMRRPV